MARVMLAAPAVATCHLAHDRLLRRPLLLGRDLPPARVAGQWAVIPHVSVTYQEQYSSTVSERLTREHEHVFSWPCSRIGTHNTCATVPQRIATACTVPLRC